MKATKAKMEIFNQANKRLALHRFAGAGSPLLALHGFTGSGLDFAALAEHFGGSLHCPDLPGHGASGTLGAGQGELSGIEQCSDTLLALMQASAMERPALLGYSMGGRTALTLAFRHPGAVSALVLIGASPGLADASAREQRRALDDQRARELEQQGTVAFMDRWQELPLLRSQQRMPARHWQDFSKRRRGADPQGLAWSLRAMGTGAMPSLWEHLTELTVPTLMITGEQDERYTAIAGEMADKIPNATCEVIAAAGHSPHLEQPEAVAELLCTYLLSIDRDS